MFRQPAQEGYGRMQMALHEHAFAGGKQLANMVIGEHIEKVQNVLLSKASPFHYLKAAADINFRFTRYATRMQTAVAYLDYMAKAERQSYFIDEMTGEKMEMTKERAMDEGMRHVEQVFGDLRSMSPLGTPGGQERPPLLRLDPPHPQVRPDHARRPPVAGHDPGPDRLRELGSRPQGPAREAPVPVLPGEPRQAGQRLGHRHPVHGPAQGRGQLRLAGRVDSGAQPGLPRPGSDDGPPTGLRSRPRSTRT